MRPPPIKITKTEIRDKFNRNEGGYPAKIDQLRRVTSYDRLASPETNQPPGTRSRIYRYYDGPAMVMLVHCLVRPDGTLGGSGQYDPKRLLVDGIEYFTH